MNSISTDSYKGVRDFYPEDMFVQKYIFDTMRKVAERYGYTEYNASVLEPTELYKSKSSEEIVNDQTYSFKDRGDRDVTLRPEMTPTVARMVAAKKRELAYPLRWYSIPNLFRYEKPQRGRLREHWQLNVDLFGINTLDADAEIITIAARLLETYGAKAADYEIRVSHRGLLRFVLEKIYGLNADDAHTLIKLIDKKDKMEAPKFLDAMTVVLGDKAESLIKLLELPDATQVKDGMMKWHNVVPEGIDDIMAIQEKLKAIGIETKFDLSLARGFDYYTGIVFEVFDTNPENRRSLFGGGRYDDLLSVFGSEKVPAVGFGAGDVGMRDFLEVRGLIPKFKSPAAVYICPLDENEQAEAFKLAEFLRSHDINAAIDLSDKKIGDKIKTAVKLSIPHVLIVGPDEISSGEFALKTLETQSEEKLTKEALVSKLTH